MITFSHWRFNPDNGVLKSNTEEHRLPPRLVKLLLILTENSQKLVERDELISLIWRDKVVNDDALARAIAELRGFLGDNSQNPIFIETVPRRGYRFKAEVYSGVSGQSVSVNTRAIAVLLTLCFLAVLIYLLMPSSQQQDRTGYWQTKVDSAARINADAQLEYQPEISKSGKLFAYGRRQNEDMVVEIRDSFGEKLYSIEESGAWVLSPAWSPNEDELAVAIATREACNVYLIAIPDLSRERISPCTIPNASGILDWSPDGNKIAFVARTQEGNSQPSIMLKNLDSGAIERITAPTQADAFDTRPRFSHDGESLFFLRGTHSARNIYQADVNNGAAVNQLTSGKDLKLSFTASDSSSEIIFDSDRNGDRNLWLLSLSDNSIQNIGARDSQFPSLSASGELLFQEIRYQANLWYFDFGQNKATVRVASPKYDNNPAISPDANLVAYSTNRFGYSEIWLFDLSTSQDIRLYSHENTNLVAPVWSKDGNRLLMSAHSNQGYACFEMRVANKEIRKIDPDGESIHHCHYMPDESILAIRKTENAEPALLLFKGDSKTVLTEFGVNKAMPLLTGQIVFSSNDRSGLHVLNPENGHIESLAANASQRRPGKWTVAGNAVYFQHAEKPNELWSIDVTTNNQTRVMEGLNTGIGNSIAVSPSESFAIVSQKGQDQSYLFIAPR